ncbi:MAG: caspase family protein, partial [Methylocella sp.]
MAVRFLSVLILTFWAGTALADKRVALIVGNSQYTRISPKLINPANDSHDIAKALQSIGFTVLLKTDIGKGEFDRSLAQFAREAAGADTALFYYAGHGLQYQRQNYFLPVDIEVQDSADVEFQAVAMDRILEAINHAAGVKIVILDACRDNPLAKQFSTRSLNGGGATRGLARIDRTEGLIIAYATAPDQVAQDGAGRNSPFTESLVKRIKEPGLEIGTMFRRVANDVFERTNGRQRPEYSDSLLSDYFLNPVESDSIAYSRIRDSNELADFQEFIRKFPASPFVRDAQIRIDLFERLRRLNEEEAKAARERIALEAAKK